MAMEALRGWTKAQRNVVIASFLGWTLDAFDFFLLIYVIRDIAAEFKTDITSVTLATFLTLAMRPLGAFIFGRAADRYGRRPVLMVDIIFYSGLAFLSGFAPNLMTLIVIRALFGVAMGGEWGVGASLTMETIPPKARGIVSGLLQCGYPTGHLIASLAYGTLFTSIGWRGMLMLGALPALLVLYIRRNVPESPAWTGEPNPAGRTMTVVQRHWKLAIYAILMMTGFNFFSHGTQDIYPTFLQVQHKFDPALVGTIGAIMNVGALMGGLTFGAWSEHVGRRRAIVTATLCSLLVLPFWAFSVSPLWLALTAFMMQFLVQGAWGVVPAHLNELSPPEARGTFPGFTYQLGNLISSSNLTLQAAFAASYGGNYALSLAIVGGGAAVLISVLVGFGIERKGVHMGARNAAMSAAPE